MSRFVPVYKDEAEGPVPSAWRTALSDLVEAFAAGDFQLEGAACVGPLSKREAQRISGNIEAYGARLVSLPDEAWETSVCIWLGNWWEVLVDLFTVEEGPSDLVLFVKVHADGQSYRFEIHSVHVP